MLRIFLLIILAIIAYFDAKRLEIDDKFLSLLLGTIIIWTPTDIMLQNLPAAAIIWIFYAAIIFICSLLNSNIPMGMGDIILLGVLALYTGGFGIALIFAAASLISGIFAVLLLAIKKAGSKSEIPFAPFIAAGFGIYAFLI